MIPAGGGTIVNITSASAYADPTKPAGQGGWGMGYGISKGALQPVAGFISLELGAHGVRCFNVQPGLIATERMAQDMSKFGFENDGSPPEVVGQVVRWLCTEDGAAELNGPSIEAQFFCHDNGLLPCFGPRIKTANKRYDRSGAILAELKQALNEENS